MTQPDPAMSEPEGEDDLGEAHLDDAIEELRGALKDEGGPAGGAGFGSAANSNVVMSIPVDVEIVLGSTRMSVSELMALRKGSTVALDRRIGEPVDIVVNGRKIARGEIVVLEDDPSRFGVKLTEITTAAKPAT